MEIKTVIKRIGTIALLMVLCFILQTGVFSRLQLAGVTPNLMLILTASFGFMRGRKEGMAVGFFCGLLVDMATGNYVGLYTLLYMYLGFFNGLFKKIFYGDDLKLPMFLIAVTDLMYGLAIYLFMFIMYQNREFGFYVFNVILPEMVYTILVSIFLYYLILKVNQWLEKENRRSADRFVG